MQIEILQLIEGAKRARGLTVVIDVFRAMTVESFLMNSNPDKLIPVGDVQIARDYKASHPDTVLCGERGGAIIDGFDYGNSPSAIESVDFTGKTVIHTTSAGTQGIANAVGADEILGGCLVNANAIACYIKKQNPQFVSLVCMGLAGKRPTDEDTLCALYIKSLLEGQPLLDLDARIEALKHTDGAKFFDKSQQHIFPQRDFELSTMVGICPFVLRLSKDPESGLDCMERVDVPEAFSIAPGARMSQYSREQVTFFPDWLKGRIVYGDYTEPEGNFDAALVLGGASFLMESRAKAAADLYRAGRCSLFITTGGVRRESIYGTLPEAQILALHMMDLGVPQALIIPEMRATTTHENYKFSKPILEQRFSGHKCRLATVSSYGHLVRSVKLAYAYIPEHDHVAYRALVSTDTPERFSESPEMRKRATKECRCLWNYVSQGLIPDFLI